eukprot:350477-Chlamydomonas_euryale.AAC.2
MCGRCGGGQDARGDLHVAWLARDEPTMHVGMPYPLEWWEALQPAGWLGCNTHSWTVGKLCGPLNSGEAVRPAGWLACHTHSWTVGRLCGPLNSGEAVRSAE